MHTPAETKELPSIAGRLILPDTSAPDLYARLLKTSPIPIVSANDAISTDIRIIDARTEVPLTIDPAQPALVVFNPTSLAAEFNNSLHALNTENIELITDTELDSPALLLRLQLWQSRIQHPATEDIVRANAHAILQSVMRESNDWMVLKGLENRFLLASAYACKSFQLSESEIIGKNDLEIGTPEELVLGKPGTHWLGFWEHDKRLTDKGDSAVIEPLAVSDSKHPMFGESTTKHSLKNHHGEVFALLVTISSVTLEKDTSDASAMSLNSIWA